MISKKAQRITPSPTLTIDTKYKSMIAEGEDAVGFGCGEPDFDTPQYIKDAAIKAMNEGKTKYTPAAGTLARHTPLLPLVRALVSNLPLMS